MLIRCTHRRMRRTISLTSRCLFSPTSHSARRRDPFPTSPLLHLPSSSMSTVPSSHPTTTLTKLTAEQEAAHAAAVQHLLTPRVKGASNPHPPRVHRYRVSRHTRLGRSAATPPATASQRAVTTAASLFIETSASPSQVAFLVHDPLSSTLHPEQLRGIESSTLYTFEPQTATVSDLLHCTALIHDVYRGLRHAVDAPSSITVTAGVITRPASGDANHGSSVPPSTLLSALLDPPTSLFHSAPQVFLTLSLPANPSLFAIRFATTAAITAAEKSAHQARFDLACVWAADPIPEYINDGMALMGASFMGALHWGVSYLGNHLLPLITHPRTALQPFRVWEKPQPPHKLPGVFPMLGDGEDGKGEVRIGLAADWAAGTMESDMVQAAMVGTRTVPELRKIGLPTSPLPYSRPRPHYTVHCGDVYYLGLPEEVRSNFLGEVLGKYKQGVTWPAGTRGQLAIPGNHEMYSGGSGLYGPLLDSTWVNDKTQKQEASYFAMAHADWLLIALDTGYDSYAKWPSIHLTHLTDSTFDNPTIDLPLPQKQWLTALLADTAHSHKGLVFLSHHQVASSWEKSSGQTRFQQSVVGCINNPQRRVVWLYGHEHRLAMYDGDMDAIPNGSGALPLRAYHRCVGNSGFPCEVTILPTCARRFGLQAYDDRVYQVEVDELASLPIAFNGFTHITIRPPHGADADGGGSAVLVIEYSTIRLQGDDLTSEQPTRLYSETFEVREGSVNKRPGQEDERLAGMTRVVHVQSQPLPATSSLEAVITLQLSASQSNGKEEPAVVFHM